MLGVGSRTDFWKVLLENMKHDNMETDIGSSETDNSLDQKKSQFISETQDSRRHLIGGILGELLHARAEYY